MDIPADVNDDPGDVTQELDGDARVDERKQRRDDAERDDIVPELRPVADDVAQRPDGLLAHVLVRRVEQLEKQRDRVGLDDGLRLGGRSRGDVGQGPGRFELQVRAGKDGMNISSKWNNFVRKQPLSCQIYTF